jgi:hypothetical protein
MMLPGEPGAPSVRLHIRCLGELTMPGPYPEDRRAWLLEIGRRLRAEYDAVADPVPPRLVELLTQLEAPDGTSVQEERSHQPDPDDSDLSAHHGPTGALRRLRD